MMVDVYPVQPLADKGVVDWCKRLLGVETAGHDVNAGWKVRVYVCEWRTARPAERADDLGR